MINLSMFEAEAQTQTHVGYMYKIVYVFARIILECYDMDGSDYRVARRHVNARCPYMSMFRILHTKYYIY